MYDDTWSITIPDDDVAWPQVQLSRRIVNGEEKELLYTRAWEGRDSLVHCLADVVRAEVGKIEFAGKEALMGAADKQFCLAYEGAAELAVEAIITHHGSENLAPALAWVALWTGARHVAEMEAAGAYWGKNKGEVLEGMLRGMLTAMMVEALPYKPHKPRTTTEWFEPKLHVDLRRDRPTQKYAALPLCWHDSLGKGAMY